MAAELPCDGEGVCMVCNNKAEGTINCTTCTTPWHATCLRTPPKTLADEANWVCPDCSGLAVEAPVSVGGGELVEKIRAIESDSTLTQAEKAQKRQALLSGGNGDAAGDGKKMEKGNGADGALGILDDKFKCSICMLLLDRPVSTPCGHNFCLKCFQKWVGQQGKKTCAMCREPIPAKMAAEPRINSAIVMAIRMAKHSQTNSASVPKVYHVIHNQDRPDKAFTTERAKKSGIANACSGKIFVTIPSDHFGPITAEYDPTRNQGVLVGETWRDRMECRQWGAHFSHVAGITGQSNHGAQSVALSGGYEDDEDHGDWFLYTGSGGRDLSGNKRTNKFQSFDQKFTKSNEALRVSCRHGYPVRVVRSHKEKRSSYAPAEGVRYDGVYRIEKCWHKVGIQGFKVCRYLFVRCDNEPAPWTSDDHGDRPRSALPAIEELNNATDVFERKGSPNWDYDEEQSRWVWKKPPPESCKTTGDQDSKDNETKKRKRKNGKGSIKERLLKEFSCLICRKVMAQPLTTPCAHNFCKACLEGNFAGQSFVKQRTCGGRRTLRAQKNVMKCPICQNDITEFLQNPQVNRELQDVIESLQTKMEEEVEENKDPYGEGDGGDNDDEGNDTDEGEGSKGSDETSNNKENCDVNAKPDFAEMGEDALKDSLRQSEADQPKRNPKRMKPSEEAGALASDVDKS